MNAAVTRARLVRRGTHLEWFTVVYNSLEGLVSVAAGLMAGSVSLVGFGLDSVIEVISGVALLWRFHRDEDLCRRERTERQALRVVGGCFVALAPYIGLESGLSLWRHEAPERSVPGIAIAALSVVVMPLLARAKRRVAREISSGALHADARQTDFCLYLSVILLTGLSLNALLGWWWADSVAALAMTPIIAWEGLQGLKGKSACGCH